MTFFISKNIITLILIYLLFKKEISNKNETGAIDLAKDEKLKFELLISKFEFIENFDSRLRVDSESE